MVLRAIADNQPVDLKPKLQSGRTLEIEAWHVAPFVWDYECIVAML
jgi:hypothetical protein